jgi:hypothetical protein
MCVLKSPGAFLPPSSVANHPMGLKSSKYQFNKPLIKWASSLIVIHKKYSTGGIPQNEYKLLVCRDLSQLLFSNTNLKMKVS